MAQTDLYNAKNEKMGSLELPGGLLGGRVSAGLLHEVASVTPGMLRTCPIVHHWHWKSGEVPSDNEA